MLRRFVFILILTLTSLTVRAQPFIIGTLTPTDCPIDIPAGAVVDCATLTVPEHHGQLNGKTLQLAVAVLHARNDNPQPDPVLYLEGGPGAGAVTNLQAWVGRQITADRDLILFDQRGTGYSQPGLFCEQYDYDLDVSWTDPQRYAQVYYKACAKYLTQDGIDLSAYNSAESAADAAMLVKVLGYKDVNVYGVSYGTRVALTVMRDYPEVVRAVVLDSPYPPQAQGFEQLAPNGWSALHALLDACAADSECNRAIPHLQSRLSDFVKMSYFKPIIHDFGDGERTYYGSDFIGLVFRVMYDTSAIPYLPAALNELINGNPEALAALYLGDENALAEKLRIFHNYSAAVSNSMFCSEEVPFNDPDLTIQLAKPVPDAFELALYWPAKMQFAVCMVWGVAPAGEVESQAVVSDLPTLVLVGQFDPITPPILGEMTVSTLRNGTLVVMPGAGHGIIDANPCGASLGVAFLNQPTEVLDVACVADIDTWFSPTNRDD